MPISATNVAAAGRAYIDIRVGECQVHQGLLDVSTLTGVDDADGNLAPGLPIRTNGAPVTAGTDAIIGLVGPEPVKLQAADHFGNVFVSGTFNKNAIEDNLGRALTANELAAIALVPAIRLI
jgi:hypothetical protein